MVLMFRLLVTQVSFHDFPFLSSCNGLTYIIFLFTSLFLHYSDLTRLNFPSPIPLAPAFLFFFSFHFYFLHLAKFWPSSKLIPHSFKVHSPPVPFFFANAFCTDPHQQFKPNDITIASSVRRHSKLIYHACIIPEDKV